MTPVLPAFTGHVPPSFEIRFPEAKIDKTEWIDYPAVSILSPSDSMFTVIAKMFVEEEIGTYGTNHYYTADTFNENLPPTSDPEYLASMSNVVYEGMAGADPDAVWVMQAWLFYHQADFGVTGRSRPCWTLCRMTGCCSWIFCGYEAGVEKGKVILRQALDMVHASEFRTETVPLRHV